jgi:hypothetical protein
MAHFDSGETLSSEQTATEIERTEIERVIN